jgi:protoporphyrinogen oxidase
MENSCSEVTHYDALIVGGGFKGMMAAYGLRKQGKSVLIVEAAKTLGGFMTPLSWKGVELDKGPQYLDGVTKAQKNILDDIMAEFEPLNALDFSYASYWNNQLTADFAIPDYRTLPVEQRALLLYESLHQTAQEDTNHDSIADEFNENCPVSAHYIKNWCRKFLGVEADELSPINKSFVTFFGRKLLLENDLSLELKTLPLLDDVLAAEKKTVNHQTYNLYPMGRNLGYFRAAFEHKLQGLGVDSMLESQLVELQKSQQGLVAIIETQQNTRHVTADKVYFSGTVESTEALLLGTQELAGYIKPVSQVFYYAELEQHQNLPFYTMNYSNDSISRVTYFSDYGADSENGKPVICIEVPAEMESPIWQDPDAHFPVVSKELSAMGIGSVADFKAFKVPSTYRLILKGYEDKLSSMYDQVLQRYGNGVTILTPHLLTRASIMTDLTNVGVLNLD